MIIVDKALKQREDAGKPIRVGIIGAGYMGRGLALQIITAIPGMVVTAIYNRTLSEAERALKQSGLTDYRYAKTTSDVENAGLNNKTVYTDDPMIICEADNIDCIVEATGEVEFGAQVVLKAIDHGKHIVLLNAELDAIIGPLLKAKAKQAGVCITNCDGDQPGVVMNLFRWVQTIGYNPVLAGNMKGLQDNYRNPTTQAEFARMNKQKPKMVTSFADGTKISMEMAVVANATGFKVGKRGMYGPECKHATEAVDLFPMEQLMNGGLVDYVLGAVPGPGVFVLGYNDNPIKQQYAQYLKMGDGPLYCFYVPYHLPHLETPLSVARAVLFNDATIEPMGAPVAEVLTTAKTNLTTGTILDGIGGYHNYGQIDNANTCRELNALPMSLSQGCKLIKDVKKDQIITYDDIELPTNRLIDKLFIEQTDLFK
jgi:predicted homoserine dehydrogenase-like protein